MKTCFTGNVGNDNQLLSVNCSLARMEHSVYKFSVHPGKCMLGGDFSITFVDIQNTKLQYKQ